jgi:hypothetical protein
VASLALKDSLLPRKLRGTLSFAANMLCVQVLQQHQSEAICLVPQAARRPMQGASYRRRQGAGEIPPQSPRRSRLALPAIHVGVIEGVWAPRALWPWERFVVHHLSPFRPISETMAMTPPEPSHTTWLCNVNLFASIYVLRTAKLVG